jgi:DNA-binding transcriptional ArsR family regulator
MPKPAQNELHALYAEVCSALAEPVRIAILYKLCDGPRNVGQLVTSLELNQTTVSRHLRFLRDHSMVIAERNGANVVYSLADERIIQALDLMRAVLTGILQRRQILLQDILAQQS